MTKPKNIRDVGGISFNLDELSKLASKGKESFTEFVKAHFWLTSNDMRKTERTNELWDIVQDYSMPIVGNTAPVPEEAEAKKAEAKKK